jgi:hypothetical protein
MGATVTKDMMRKAVAGDKFKKLVQEIGQGALDDVGAQLTAPLALAGLELGDGTIKFYA